MKKDSDFHYLHIFRMYKPHYCSVVLLYKGNIIKVCKGEKFTCGGYIWRYKR